jgi:hypothetical protein
LRLAEEIVQLVMAIGQGWVLQTSNSQYENWQNQNQPVDHFSQSQRQFRFGCKLFRWFLDPSRPPAGKHGRRNSPKFRVLEFGGGEALNGMKTGPFTQFE